MTTDHFRPLLDNTWDTHLFCARMEWESDPQTHRQNHRPTVGTSSECSHSYAPMCTLHQGRVRVCCSRPPSINRNGSGDDHPVIDGISAYDTMCHCSGLCVILLVSIRSSLEDDDGRVHTIHQGGRRTRRRLYALPLPCGSAHSAGCDSARTEPEREVACFPGRRVFCVETSVCTIPPSKSCGPMQDPSPCWQDTCFE